MCYCFDLSFTFIYFYQYLQHRFSVLQEFYQYSYHSLFKLHYIISRNLNSNSIIADDFSYFTISFFSSMLANLFFPPLFSNMHITL